MQPSSEQSDTPKTDAAVIAAPEYATPEYVHGDFARELERENARLRELVERITAYYPPRAKDLAMAMGYLAHLRAQ